MSFHEILFRRSSICDFNQQRLLYYRATNYVAQGYDENPYGSHYAPSQAPAGSETYQSPGGQSTPSRSGRSRPTQPPPAPPSNASSNSTPTVASANNTPTRGRSMSTGRDTLPPPPPPPGETMSPPSMNGTFSWFHCSSLEKISLFQGILFWVSCSWNITDSHLRNGTPSNNRDKRDNDEWETWERRDAKMISTLIFRLHTVASAEQERKSVGQSFAKPALDPDPAESYSSVGRGWDGPSGTSGSPATSANPRSHATEAHFASM